MIRGVSEVQKHKIKEGTRLIQHSADPECLFRVVVVVGPTIFGSIFKSNSNTVWSRIEKPVCFKYEEIKKLAEAFGISICRFNELIEMQTAHNKSELLKRRPIGRKKYNPEKYNENQ